MQNAKKRFAATLLVVATTFVGIFGAVTAAQANSNLCVTHFSRQPGPSGYHSHTVGNFLQPPDDDYKIVQYFKAGPGYIYLADTRRRWCG